MPQQAAGILIEPPVSVPTVASAMPVATLTADPPLDPPGDRVVSSGLRTAPNAESPLVVPRAYSCRFVLPTKTAPAARRLATHGASCDATRPTRTRDAAVVSVPRTSMRSLIESGTPCSGPRSRPAASSRSASRACRRASSAITRMNALVAGLPRLDPRQALLDDGLGRDRSRAKLRAELLNRHARQRFTEMATPSRSGTMDVSSAGWLVQAHVVVDDRLRVGGVVVRRPDEARHDLAAPQHVVRHEQAARPEQIHETIEHRPVLLLVAVLKDEIERAGHLRQHPLRVADDDADAIGEAGAGEILARLPRAILVVLHREQRAAGRQRAREPDAGIADGGADFEDARGAHGGRQHAQQRAHLRVDQRKIALLTDARDVPQHRHRPGD